MTSHLTVLVYDLQSLSARTNKGTSTSPLSQSDHKFTVLPDDDGDDLQNRLIQTLAEVDQCASVGPHSAQHYPWSDGNRQQQMYLNRDDEGRRGGLIDNARDFREHIIKQRGCGRTSRH